MTSNLYQNLDLYLYQDLNHYQRINPPNSSSTRAKRKWFGKQNSTFELIVSRLDASHIYAATALAITWLADLVSQGFINSTKLSLENNSLSLIQTVSGSKGCNRKYLKENCFFVMTPLLNFSNRIKHLALKYACKIIVKTGTYPLTQITIQARRSQK